MREGEDFAEFEKNLIRFATCQKRLRTVVAKAAKDSKMSTNEIANKCNLGQAEVKKFLTGESVLASERKLKAICKFANCEELIEPNLAAAKNIADRFKIFATVDTDTIRIGTQLIRLFQENYPLPTNNLAEVFGQDAEVVFEVLKPSRIGIHLLSETECSERVLGLLTDTSFGDTVATVRTQFLDDYNAEAAEFKQLVDRLLPLYDNQLKLVATEAFGVNYSTIRRAVQPAEDVLKNGSLVGQETMLHLKRTATAILAGEKPKAPAAKSDEPVLPPPQPEAIPDPSQDVFGPTTEDGVAFVLTESTFQQIANVPVIAMRDALKKSIIATRQLLNVAAQMSDEQARDILQEDLGKELRELLHSMRTFSMAHPNEILPLIDSQRSTLINKKGSR